eukprot:15398969-Alexandrium_andersonii.AAC.1
MLLSSGAPLSMWALTHCLPDGGLVARGSEGMRRVLPESGLHRSCKHRSASPWLAMARRARP